MRRASRITTYILAGIVVLAALLRISLPHLIPRIANPILSREIGTDVEISGLQLQLLRGQARIQSITVAQPEGFTPAMPLLRMTGPAVKISLNDLLQKHIHIRSFDLAALEVHIIRNTNGVLNVAALRSRPPGDPETAPEPMDKSLPVVSLNRFDLHDAIISYTDHSVSPSLRLALTNLQMEAAALRFDPPLAAGSTNLHGHLQLTATLLQKGFPDGYLGTTAAIGILSTNVPAVNAAARIVGFDLQCLREILPAGIATFLGGSNLDIAVDAALAPTFLQIQNEVQTAGNTWRLTIGGRPDKIEIDTATALFNVVTRPTAFLSGAVEGVAQAGVTAGRSVVTTAGQTGSGIIKGVANIGSSAARSVKSAARGDIRGIGESVKDMTYGTVTGAVDTVSATIRNVGEGLGDTVSAAAGRTKSRDWNTANAKRWEQKWNEARNFIAQAPYPGPSVIPHFETLPAEVGDPMPDALSPETASP